MTGIAEPKQIASDSKIPQEARIDLLPLLDQHSILTHLAMQVPGLGLRYAGFTACLARCMPALCGAQLTSP
jgi:hypothetical protein